MTSHVSEPAIAPSARAGTRPAFTTDDLPMPDGPTTTSSRSLLEDLDHLGDGTFATVEVLGVGLLERGEAAVGVAGRYERRRRVDWHGECVAQLGLQLVDRLLASARVRVGRPGDDEVDRSSADRQRTVQWWR